MGKLRKKISIFAEALPLLVLLHETFEQQKLGSATF